MRIWAKRRSQAFIIKRMVADLNFDITIHILPTVRETDGLAMSSRNTYLNPKGAASSAGALPQSCAAKENHTGERDAASLIAYITKLIKQEPLVDIDYVNIVDLENCSPAKNFR